MEHHLSWLSFFSCMLLWVLLGDLSITDLIWLFSSNLYLPQERWTIPTCPAPWDFSLLHSWCPATIAINFLKRLLTIAANFFGMVDATIATKHILAFAHVRPSLKAQTLRVAERLFLYSNPKPDIPGWMLHLSPGIKIGTFVMTVTAVANWAESPVNTADRIRSDSICSVDCEFCSAGNSCNCQKGIIQRWEWLRRHLIGVQNLILLYCLIVLWLSWHSHSVMRRVKAHEKCALVEGGVRKDSGTSHALHLTL